MNLAKNGVLVLVMAVACKGQPTTSYCEALCDWAVGCASAERTVEDADALTQSCLDATRASDPSCAKAESGDMNPAALKLLDGCTNDIAGKSTDGDCSGFTGSIPEQKVGKPPTSCAATGTDVEATYNVARDAVTETNEELCDRVTATICQRASDCILGDKVDDIPQAAVQALGGTPFDLCVERMASVITDKCVSNDLYSPEDSFTDVNAAREGARGCMNKFDTVECTDLVANPPHITDADCVVMFASPDDLVQVGKAVVDLSSDYAPYLQ